MTVVLWHDAYNDSELPQTIVTTHHGNSIWGWNSKFLHVSFGVEIDSLTNVVGAGVTLYVEGHLEVDYQDSFAEFMGATTEGVGPCHLVDVGLAVVVWRIVLVEQLHLDDDLKS
jgi:hypothetical protein